MASALCISPRTLIRQLEQRDTSFRLLLEEQQPATSRKFLRQARYGVADVGELPG